jgi:hypothetical protein
MSIGDGRLIIRARLDCDDDGGAGAIPSHLVLEHELTPDRWHLAASYK